MSPQVETLCPDELFSEVERDAWAPDEPLTVSQWAERYRSLSRDETHQPGPWSNAAAPYLAGMMDLMGDPSIRELAIQKAGQMGASEAARCWVAYCAAREPDPFMYTMADEKTGREQIERRFIPLFEQTPVLAALLSERLHDTKLSSITLTNGFWLKLAFAGSARQLKTNPFRFALGDEVDEWDAQAMDKMRIRVRTYYRTSKLVWISTPERRDGNICREVRKASNVLHYFVPCPHCGKYQTFEWGRFHWENVGTAEARSGAENEKEKEGEKKKEHAAPSAELGASAVKTVSNDELAGLVETRLVDVWMECSACDERIIEAHKGEMVACGVWAVGTAEAQSFAEDAKKTTRLKQRKNPAPAAELGASAVASVCRAGWKPGLRVALKIWAGYCLWKTWPSIVADFLRARGDDEKEAEFTKQTLGQPFVRQIEAPTESVFEAKCRVPWPGGVVPNWAARLLATADVHGEKKGIYAVIRAWAAGPQLRSRRIWHGIVGDFDALRSVVFGASFAFEDKSLGALGVEGLAIDRRYRTEEVDAECRRDATRCKALEGVGTPQPRWAVPRESLYTPPGQKRPYNAYYNTYDPNRAKDWLAGAIGREIEVADPRTGEVSQVAQWELNNENDETYNSQMAAERKVSVMRAGRPVEVWENPENRANHWLDCEVMQRVLAYMMRIEDLAGRPQRRRSFTERQTRRPRRARRWE